MYAPSSPPYLPPRSHSRRHTNAEISLDGGGGGGGGGDGAGAGGGGGGAVPSAARTMMELKALEKLRSG